MFITEPFAVIWCSWALAAASASLCTFVLVAGSLLTLIDRTCQFSSESPPSTPKSVYLLSLQQSNACTKRLAHFVCLSGDSL